MEFLKVKNGNFMEIDYSPMNVVFTLIKSDKGYLLIKNQNGFWELPAGAIQKFETFEVQKCY